MTTLLCTDVRTAPAGPLGELDPLTDGEVGLWEAEPGTETDVEVDEVFVVLAGAATVVVEGGETLDLGPGVVVRLYAGDRTTWTVTERLRKLYLSGEAPSTPGGRLLAADVTTLPLTGESHPGIWIEGGWPTATTEPLGTLGAVRISAWEITEGVVADLEHDEFVLVLSGEGVLRVEHGPGVQLAPYALVRLGEGDRTEWTVTETLRAVVVSVPV